MQQIKRCWQILIDRSLESKVPRFFHPRGDQEQQEEQQQRKPFPKAGSLPLWMCFWDSAVCLDPFAEAAAVGPAGSSTAGSPQCQELSAAEEDAKATETQPSVCT